MPEREKYERLTEVEDELEREKIDLMLTVHIPASFGQVSKKALLSLHSCLVVDWSDLGISHVTRL